MLNLNAIQAAFPEIQVLRHIAESGQKHVFEAAYRGERVAFKLVKPQGDSAQRAEREILAVATLNCQYVPKIFAAGRRDILGNQNLYIIESFIEGQSLRLVLTTRGRIPVPEVVNLLEILLKACGDFEAARIVHRDIKPENLMLDALDKIWVIDFGLARHLDLTSLTADGPYGVGTVGYAAPEQFRNLKVQINSRADLYSVGMIGYEALVGQHPFLQGATHPLDVVRRMERQDAPYLNVPDDSSGQLGDFICGLIQRFPSRRPQSVSEALEYFEPIRRHYPSIF